MEAVQDGVDDLLGGEQSPVGDVGVAAGEGEQPQHVDELVDRHRQLVGVGADDVGEQGAEAGRASVGGVGVVQVVGGPTSSIFCISSKVARNRCCRIATTFSSRALSGWSRSISSIRADQVTGLEGPGDGRVDQLVLGLEDPEDRALGDARPPRRSAGS